MDEANPENLPPEISQEIDLSGHSKGSANFRGRGECAPQAGVHLFFADSLFCLFNGRFSSILPVFPISRPTLMNRPSAQTKRLQQIDGWRFPCVRACFTPWRRLMDAIFRPDTRTPSNRFILDVMDLILRENVPTTSNLRMIYKQRLSQIQ
jgi:hypothetical protein